jgi:outer membrane protein TolC
MQRLIALGLFLLLPGCQTFSPDGGMDAVSAIAGAALKKDVAALRSPQAAELARAKVTTLLRRPLTADTAVQIALLNNRGLQAAYDALGLSETVLVQSSLPPNPTIAVSRLSGSAELEIEKRIVASILALATLPARAEIAADRFHQAQLRAAEETLRMAAETRRAYYRAVAGRELANFIAQAKSGAETGSQLARRLGETGALNKLDQSREHLFYAETTAQLASTRQRAASDRERLVRQLGLWDHDFKLPEALPTLPRQARALPAIENEAVRRRVDLQIARIEIAALAKTHGLTNATRFVNMLEAGAVSRTTQDKATGTSIRDNGFDIELQIPIFDGGEVRVRQAELAYQQAVNLLLERAVNVRSQARSAYRTYRSAYDLAAHYRGEILPLRRIVSEETLLRYNAMQIDVFTLLAEARQRINTGITAIEAQREFWLASADLDAAVVGGGTSGATGEASRAILNSPAESGGH